MSNERQLPDGLPYQRMLQECLRGELRVLNAYLPCKQKPLSNLLGEEYPNVVGYDGSTHLFKRKELEYLASLLDTGEQEALLLPMLIEVNPGQGEMAIICRGDVEEKVIEARKRTGYGRKRLSRYLAREEGIILSPHTLRHILSRNGFKGKRKPRRIFYPAYWVWEMDKPFSLAQVDTKDILDKGT